MTFWDAINGRWVIRWEDWCSVTYGAPWPPPSSWFGRMVAAYGMPTNAGTLDDWRVAEAGPDTETTALRRLAAELGAEEGETVDPDREVLSDDEIDALIDAGELP